MNTNSFVSYQARNGRGYICYGSAFDLFEAVQEILEWWEDFETEPELFEGHIRTENGTMTLTNIDEVRRLWKLKSFG